MTFDIKELKKALRELKKTVETQDNSLITSRLWIELKDNVATLTTSNSEAVTQIAFDTVSNDVELTEF